jgi:aminoglycoside phosphotransferase (APT) family kinase protein
VCSQPLSTDWLNSVVDALRAHDGFERLTLVRANALTGGALHKHWRLELELFDWYRNEQRAIILRRAAPPPLGTGLSLEAEAAVLKIARGVRMMAPVPLTLMHDPSDREPILVLSELPGDADPHALIEDKSLDGARIVGRLARELAKLHAVDLWTEIPGQAFPIKTATVSARLAEMSGLLEGLDDAPPGLPAAIEWLSDNHPGRFTQVLRHGDFRIGNILVHQGRVTGILDWEFAGWGAAMEDIGWLTARCWRFGQDEREVGGIGHLADFREAYEETAASPVEWDTLPYWQALATIRWAIIAACQGKRADLGGEPAEELRLTGQKAWEITHDALSQIIELDDGAKTIMGADLARLNDDLKVRNPDYLETGRFSQPR